MRDIECANCRVIAAEPEVASLYGWTNLTLRLFARWSGRVVLLHYKADQLCMWRPVEGHSLAGRTVYVYGDLKHLNHFGSQEHNYCHWLENIPPPGVYPVWRVMFDNPDMANPQKRDASALRLLSWLSFSLDKHTSALLAKLMKQLATEEENNPAILRTVQESSIGATWNSLVAMTLSANSIGPF